MPATEQLHVRSDEELVGRLDVGAAGRLTFTYDATWLASPRGVAISLSLPLREEPYVDGPGHTFFANLLPEGEARQAVCSRLGISVDNDAALLRAIGGECAGALSIVEPGAPRLDPEDYQYERLDDRRLQSLLSRERVVPLLVGGATTRLSLAGAQDKLPVALLDGRLSLALAGAPSTHILKLPHRDFAHIPVNEAFVMGLAGACGLDVVAVTLERRTDPPSLLVARYDRRPSGDPWPVVRLHQEDLCQAMGLPASRKYEQEGGPTLAAAVGVMRDHVRRPVVDVRRVIEWQAFNAVAGNSDGHGKNLSIVHDEAGPRLAPFYDLLSTRMYASLDRNLAMGVGGRRDPDQLGAARWEALAVELGMTGRTVVQLARGVAERCADELPAWRRAFREREGDEPVLQTLPRAIAKRARRLLRALA
jgi:serine/threonine-protein kinase HipA